MDNEVPKTGEMPVKETVVEPTPVQAVVPEVKAETVVTPEESAKKKPSLKEIVDMVRGYVSKLDRTTKTFIVIFGLFALLVIGFNVFKGTFVAATVNGNTVSRLSVIQELEKQAGKSVLDTMITKKLIEDEIKKQKIVVTSADIDAEIKKVEEQVVSQGGTLEQALVGRGMTIADLRDQIRVNKELEQVLAEKIAVSDEEVNQYLSTNKIPTTGTSSEETMNQAREQLKAQKFNTEASQWVTDLRAKALIEYYGGYTQ